MLGSEKCRTFIHRKQKLSKPKKETEWKALEKVALRYLFFFFPACCMCMDKGETGVLLPLNPKGRLVLGESSIWLQNPSSSVIAKLGKPTLYYFVALQCSVRNMSRGSGKIQKPQLCRERWSYSPWGPLHTFIQTDSEPSPTALCPGGQPSAASLHVCMLSHVRLFASQVFL